MNRQFLSLGILLCLILVFTLPGRFLPASCWGVNHTAYLPAGWTVFAAIMLSIAMTALFVTQRAIGVVYERVGQVLQNGQWSLLVVLLVSVAAYYFLHVQSYLLGDGYQILAHFAATTNPPLKWTEPGAIMVARGVQLLTGYGTHGALLSFQILSAASGVVYLWNSFNIARLISNSRRIQVATAIVLTTTGALTLFLGYVEFYPLNWVAAGTFIHLSLRSLRTGRGHLWAVLTFALAAFVHMQLLSLFFGLLVVLLTRLYPGNWPTHLTRHRLVYAVVIAVLAFAAAMLLQSRIQFALIFLPLFSGKPDSPEYAVLTWKHLVDIVNLTLLVFPGVIALLALRHNRAETSIDQAIRHYLGASALGAVLFLFLIDPVFGMAIDWDLMSLTLLPVVLLLVHSRNFDTPGLWPRLPVILVLTAATTTVLFAAVLADPRAGEKRFWELLEHYGRKNRSGWSILKDYFERAGDTENEAAVRQAYLHMFPEDVKLWEARALIAKGDFTDAVRLAADLVEKDPYRAEYQQIAAEAYAKVQDYERSASHYHLATALRPYDARLRHDFGLVLLNSGDLDGALRTLVAARKLDPSSATTMEAIALTHIRKGAYTEALACADTLAFDDPNAPGASLIRMVISVNRGDLAAAARYMRVYRQFGCDRSDYLNIMEYYGYLLRP